MKKCQGFSRVIKRIRFGDTPATYYDEFAIGKISGDDLVEDWMVGAFDKENLKIGLDT